MLAFGTIDIFVVEAFCQAARPAEACATSMKQKIIGFDHDDDNDWRAKLACGHYQHVRHNPPLNTREWTQTKAGRESRIGFDLNCRKCVEEKPKDF